MRWYYTIYRITNMINGKFYIGVHKTKKLKDKYFGSSQVLKLAIKKYGKKNFKKEIMQLFLTKEQMYDMESLIVDDSFVSRSDTYNAKVGGFGGWKHVNNNPEQNKKRLENLRSKMAIMPPEFFIKNTEPFCDWTGRKHSKESKKKMSKSKKGKNCGKENPQHGVHLYCNQEGLTERFKEGQQPEGWITTTEFKRSKMPQKTNFNKHWYNNGIQNFLRFEDDAKDLIRGRL